MKLEIILTGDTEADLATAKREADARLNTDPPKAGYSVASVTDTWSYTIKAKGKRVTVVYGEHIEFGEFDKGGDRYELTIINEPYQVEEMYEEDIEEIVGLQSWFILESYNGEIVTHKNPLAKGVEKR